MLTCWVEQEVTIILPSPRNFQKLTMLESERHLQFYASNSPTDTDQWKMVNRCFESHGL